MTKDEQKEAVQDANEILVDLMFCAAPEYLISKEKDLKPDFFYTIFCLKVNSNDKYVVFSKIFKALKRRNAQGLYYKIVDNQTLSFENQEEAQGYLRDFLNLWEEHDRAITSPDMVEDNIPGGTAILVINQWESLVLESFNALIQD